MTLEELKSKCNGQVSGIFPNLLLLNSVPEVELAPSDAHPRKGTGLIDSLLSVQSKPTGNTIHFFLESTGQVLRLVTDKDDNITEASTWTSNDFRVE